MDMIEAIATFGHSQQEADYLQSQGREKATELSDLDIVHISPNHASVIYAYTEELPGQNPLYKKLNLNMRSPGATAEKRLVPMRDYIHYLGDAISALPNYVGKAYRGMDCKLNPTIYQPGKMITWQQFSSCTRSQMVARRFVANHGVQLVGSVFVINISHGKGIEEFSAFPEEQEILLKYNTFLKVRSVIEDDMGKKAALTDFVAYDLTHLDVYILDQL